MKVAIKHCSRVVCMRFVGSAALVLFTAAWTHGETFFYNFDDVPADTDVAIAYPS